MALYLIAFVLAFLIAFFTTPLAKKVAFKVGAIAKPRKRDMHKKPIPRMGGIAIFLGFMITYLVVIKYMPIIDTKQNIGIIVGSFIIFFLGFFDDIYELNAKLKFLIQIAAASIVALCGIRINFISIPFLGDSFFSTTVFSIPATVIWIVGITNAVNLIDGLDGLAAGVSSIAALSLMALSISTGYVPAVVLTATLAGACIGFLPYNFNPASIFMGDTGSTFLGFTLAVTSILGLLKGYTMATIFIAVLVLGLPIFDTAFAIIRRFLAGKPIMSPDRGHLHHRLVDKGYSQKQAVVTLYGISGILGLSAIAFFNRSIKFVFIVFLMMGFLLYFNMKAMSSHDKNNEN
ncbi:undecaprenyl-phosphate alpha-N-acetylglucosaminyl 1-phosphate transferase [Sporanaerobium hydrogeniformans]|uniref:Undecaprenyl-phosphate alpha-N-acetylglucosaminyl 1-phosphate transferase n=2 Tax=Sporanaerobium hydrogeniformans TaxID=3072179 RepID=A0AC61DAA3_9FIRM|nr:undecaprenyl-phosphate alpha-N-acetylglucosaminyl 1-phosphate transferase [Sporanaerobium hydrogeniformans]